jgi:pilus assembly protein CpaE
MTRTPELTAVLICPDRALAQEFSSAIADLKALNIVGEVKEYPATALLDQRLKHLRPDLVLLDMASDRETGLRLIAHLVTAHPTLAVIGLHHTRDSETILLCLRAGVAEFLHAPFRLADAEQALNRLVRRKESDVRQQPPRGRLVAFVPAKGGSGATTVAAHVAYYIRKLTAQKVLLADFDLTAGTICFLFKLSHSYSLLDAMKHSHQLDESLWGSLVANHSGMDILPAPEKPHTAPIEAYRVHECLEYARSFYDYVVVDLPSISEKVAGATLNEADEIYLVTSPALPSLFLARKTLALVEEMGLAKDKVRVLVNRLNKRDDLSLGDMEKIFRYPIFATFPGDEPGVRRALTEGKPLADNTELGAACRRFAEGLVGGGKSPKKPALGGLKALFGEKQLVAPTR